MFINILRRAGLISILSCSLFLIFANAVCYSHGVEHTEIGGGVLVEAGYAGGKPIANCSVRIYSPDNKDEEFQSGYTGPNGNYVFYPDTRGVWKIMFDDGKGYKRTVNKEISGTGVGIQARYADDTPISYSDATVYYPGSEEEFQQGLTDRNGRYLFSPDREGEWKIKIDDGMGHGVIAKLSVGEDLRITGKAAGARFRIWQKILIGISIIWGFTGIYYYLFTRKKLLKIDKK